MISVCKNNVSNVREYVFYYFQISHTRFFNWHVKKTSLAEVKKCSPESVKMISQLRFGFTLNFLSCVIYVIFIAVVNQLFMAEYWIACNVPLTSTHSVTPNDWVVSKKYTFLRLSSCRNFYVFSVVAHVFSNVDTGMLPVSGSTDCSASILKILLSSLSSLHSNSMTSQ